MDYSGSLNRRDYIRDYFQPPNEGKDYTWYISGIFPANWVIIYFQAHQNYVEKPEKSIEMSLT